MDRRRNGGGNLARYRVILDFEAEDSFSMEVTADGRTAARRLAEREARAHGWGTSVVLTTVKPLYREQGDP